MLPAFARRTRRASIASLQRGIHASPSAEKGVGGEAPSPPRHPGATVVLTSGGLESAALLAYWSHWSHASDLIPLFVNLGQANALREEAAARDVASRLGLPSPEVLSLAMLGEQFAEMGRGERRHSRASFRNLMLLSVAASTAAEVGAAHVAIAVSADHARSSDASLAFLRHAEALLHVLDPPVSLLAPFAQLTTAKVVELGERVGAPWEATWSCVGSGPEHCGACEPCLARAEALAGAGRGRGGG